MPRINVWQLSDSDKHAELSEVFKAKTQDSELLHTSTIDERWTSLKDKLLYARITHGGSTVVEQPGGGSKKGEAHVL